MLGVGHEVFKPGPPCSLCVIGKCRLCHHCCAGVVKHVRHVRGFVTTAIISMWAYVWMLLVYLWWTPSEVNGRGDSIVWREHGVSDAQQEQAVTHGVPLNDCLIHVHIRSA
jgi:hypothetical protein